MMCVFVALEGVFCVYCNTHSLCPGFSEFVINKTSTFLVGVVFATMVYFIKLGICVLNPLEA